MLIRLIFIFLIGCSSMLDEQHQQVANEAVPYFRKFCNMKQGMCGSVVVKFTPLMQTDEVLGKTFYGAVNLVKLDTSLLTIMKYDPLFFETVLYHELGHAMLGRSHCFNCYSLMNPNAYVSDYRQNPLKRKILLNELIK